MQFDTWNDVAIACVHRYNQTYSPCHMNHYIANHIIRICKIDVQKKINNEYH
jgi:hypothetical protein